MGNPRGQAARFAYDPAVLTTYIAAKSDYCETDIKVHRNGKSFSQRSQIRLLNGIRFDQGDDARRVLRWRSGTRGVSKGATERFLQRYNLTTEQFERWAKANKLRAILWDRTSETTRSYR